MPDEISITKYDVDQDADTVPEWVARFVQDDIGTREGPDIEANGCDLPPEAHCDCQLKFLYAFTKLPQLPRANDVREVWTQQFSTFEDQNFSSIILEFLQNARDLDVPAADLSIEITDDHATLGHENPYWTYAQLSAAVQLNISSKRGEIGTIGEFGLGLKYWWLWYKRFNVTITCTCGTQAWEHALSFDHNFDSRLTTFTSKPTSSGGAGTKFHLEGWKNPEPLSEVDTGLNQFIDRIHETLSTYSDENLHLTVQLGNETHSVELTWLEDGTTLDELYEQGLEAPISNSPVRPNTPLQDVTYRKFSSEVRANDTQISCYSGLRFSTPFHPTEANRDYLRTHIVASGWGDNLNPEERIARIEEMLDNEDERSRLHFPILFGVQQPAPVLLQQFAVSGQFSQLFIANRDARKLPFVIDGPWRFKPDRLSLDLQSGSQGPTPTWRWNKAVLEEAKRAFVTILHVLISRADRFELTPSDIAPLVHGFLDVQYGRVGRVVEFQALDDEFDFGWLQEVGE